MDKRILQVVLIQLPIQAEACPVAETLNLTITPNTTQTTTVSACDNYTWSANGQTYTTSGT